LLTLALHCIFTGLLQTFRPKDNAENKNIKVWDPFCGTGTTGAVAARFGLRFHGGDSDVIAFGVAARRVDSAYAMEGLQSNILESEAGGQTSLNNVFSGFVPDLAERQDSPPSSPVTASSTRKRARSGSESAWVRMVPNDDFKKLVEGNRPKKRRTEAETESSSAKAKK
jgi:hypothetical protein